MIRINLLPVRVSKRQEAVKRELAIGAMGLSVMLLACGAVFIMIQAQVSDLKAVNVQLQQEIDNLKAIVARVDEVDKLKQDLRKKLDVIAQLKRSKHGPVHLLDELSNATPEKLTLTGLREENRNLSITGMAVSNEVISQFLSNMEQSDWFDDVYLIEIDQDEQDGYKLKTFSITARLVVPGNENVDEDG
jgi:type IV pilus assembly protein PilN